MLGFGSMNSIISGATAANCMINNLDYNVAMKKFSNDVLAKYEFRKAFNTFDNDAMDLFCSAQNLPLLKQFIYNNPLLKATYGTMFAKAYNYAVKSNPEIVNQEIENQNIACRKKIYRS
jgi:digeranylgeranylglycerophospholipid reductase